MTSQQGAPHLGEDVPLRDLAARDGDAAAPTTLAPGGVAQLARARAAPSCRRRLAWPDPEPVHEDGDRLDATAAPPAFAEGLHEEFQVLRDHRRTPCPWPRKLATRCRRASPRARPRSGGASPPPSEKSSRADCTRTQLRAQHRTGSPPATRARPPTSAMRASAIASSWSYARRASAPAQARPRRRAGIDEPVLVEAHLHLGHVALHLVALHAPCRAPSSRCAPRASRARTGSVPAPAGLAR